MDTATDDISAQDPQGRPITAATCAACQHHAQRANGSCEPGRCCMQDVSAHRIDHFFRTHPPLANPHLQHPYFEVRAIAVRYADLFSLSALMNDTDLQVRLQVAARLKMPALWRMAQDPAPEVRRVLAARLPVALLDKLAADTDWTVRWEVAGRATGAVRSRMQQDPEADVRERAAERLGAPEPAHG